MINFFLTYKHTNTLALSVKWDYSSRLATTVLINQGHFSPAYWPDIYVGKDVVFAFFTKI